MKNRKKIEAIIAEYPCVDFVAHFYNGNYRAEITTRDGKRVICSQRSALDVLKFLEGFIAFWSEIEIYHSYATAN